MQPVYDSHILKWNNVHWSKSRHVLTEAIKGCQGRQVLARVRQAGRLVELVNPNGSLEHQMRQSRVDLGAEFDLEVITRQPRRMAGETSLAAEAPGAFVDRNDFNGLQWNGERGTGSLVNSRVRNTPMFFRSNGMNADLVDLYAGQTLFLVLNGGSLSGFDWGRLKKPGICTFGVNNGAHAFRPNFWTCVDDPTRFMRSIWADPTITKFVPMAHFEKPIWDTEKNGVSEWRVKDFPNVHGYRRNEAFKAEQWLFEDTINWGNHSKLGGGRSVMLAALRIAFLLGFRKVCLVGCDFHMDDNNRYWFAEERTKNAISNNQNSYRILTDFFEQLQPQFLSSGFRVLNCNPKSHLKVFPQANLDEELRAAEIDISATTQGMYVDRYKTPKPPPKPIPVTKHDSKVLTNSRTPGGGRPVDVGILEQVIQGFETAALEKVPFTHLRLESVFLDSIYHTMLQNLPDDSRYHDLRHAHAMRPDGSSTRLRFGFSHRELGLLPGRKRIFWSLVHKALQDKRLEVAIRAVFEEALRQRFGRDHGCVAFRPQVELLRDLHGYKIGVHPDIPKKAITVQFYLPADGTREDWGTAYYARGEAGKFEEVKRMGFLPSTGHAFVVNDHSFHGVSANIGNGDRRNSLMLTYYLKDS
jgi:hypothetical protein